MTVQWIRDDYSAEDSVLICTDSQSLCSALHHVSVDPRPRRHPWKRPSRCSCQSLHQPRRTSSPRIVGKCIHAHQILIERCRMSVPTDQNDLHHYHQEMRSHHKVSQGPNPPGTTTIWSPQILAVVPELDHARGVRRHLSSMRCPLPNPRTLVHRVRWHRSGANEAFRVPDRGAGQPYHSPPGIGRAGKSHAQESRAEVARCKFDGCALGVNALCTHTHTQLHLQPY